jgi:hypothetical protein
MNVPDSIPTLWYEDEAGNYLGCPDWQNPHSQMPPNTKYQVSQFPLILRTTHLLVESGSSKEIAHCGSGCWEELVWAMCRGTVKHQPMKPSRAIQITGNACERCMNALAYEYGVGGYVEYGPEWQTANTICDFCSEAGGTRMDPKLISGIVESNISLL